jgi:hypothetical protein
MYLPKFIEGRGLISDGANVNIATCNSPGPAKLLVEWDGRKNVKRIEFFSQNMVGNLICVCWN